MDKPAIKHQQATFTAPNSTTIFHQSWQPQHNPKAVIVLVHGLGEHSGRYMNVVNHLLPQGYVICALDHQGHGKSGGRREYIKTFDDYLTALDKFVALVREQYPELPLVLLGHSMGALIALKYLVQHQQLFAAAVISGPALQMPGKISVPLIWLGKLIAALAPNLGLLPIRPEDISRDPEVVQASKDDPLVYKKRVPARLAAEILNNMHYVAERLAQITLPLLIVQGGADVIVDPQGAELLHEGVGSRDKMLKVYAGLYHEVFNEPEHPEVLADVAAWLNARV